VLLTSQPFQAQRLESYESSFRDGKPHEQYTFYVDSTGDTVRHGLYEKWYENRQIAERGCYEHGKKDSVWARWHMLGNKTSAQMWQDGIEEGRCALWGWRGDLWAVGAFHKGKRHGHWRFYAIDSIGEGRYEMGTKVGPWKETYSCFGRYQSGRRAKAVCHDMGQYIDGNREGLWRRTIDGPVGLTEYCLQLRYDNGEIVSQQRCGPTVPKELGDLFPPDSTKEFHWVPRKPTAEELSSIMPLQPDTATAADSAEQ
jgi:hypothetical protein